MGTVATLTAMKATTEIPIVFSNVGDPVGSGLVSSLARPGGNVTGTSMLTPEAAAKRLQLLKEAFPKISRVAVFVSGEPQVVPQVVEVRNAAKALGMDIQTIELRRREDFANASTVLRKWRADSAYIAASSTTLTNRELLADFMLEMQLPGVGPVPNHAEAGTLMAYGATYEASTRAAAIYVDKILKGAKPGDLPVQQATKFYLVINVKTAKMLGVTIPQSILARADRVIE